METSNTPEKKPIYIPDNFIGPNVTGFYDKSLLTEHPENGIRLIDGTVIPAYPQLTPKPDPNRFDYDKYVAGECEYVYIGEFFVKHGYYFLQHAKEILADSRMFLAAVPVNHSLAFGGTCFLSDPTLGVYIEWWQHYSYARSVDEQGNDLYIGRIAGSPMSGNNSCTLLGESGEEVHAKQPRFMPVWKSFASVNMRYAPIKEKYEAYTLEEVYEKLRAAEA